MSENEALFGRIGDLIDNVQGAVEEISNAVNTALERGDERLNEIESRLNEVLTFLRTTREEFVALMERE